jgi:ATP-dependent Lon protease
MNRTTLHKGLFLLLAIYATHIIGANNDPENHDAPDIQEKKTTEPNESDNSAHKETTEKEAVDLTPYLFIAIAQGNNTHVRKIIERSVDINKPFGPKGDTPLIFAIRTLVKLVHSYEERIFNDPITMKAAYDNRISIIQLILFQPGVQFLAENNSGQTALSLAAQEGLGSVVELLTNKIQLNSITNGQEELNKYRAQLKTLQIKPETHEKISQAIEKASNANPYESSKNSEFLKFLFSLPWDRSKEQEVNLSKVKKSLDEAHYGLEKVKARILEFMAISQLDPKNEGHKAKILCLVGPPGVGKTSLAKSIAHALNRPFTKTNLGGVYDESAIRGHSVTYVGSNAGSILKGLRDATFPQSNINYNNPVFLLDEIDKISTNNSFHGDPSAALLEVLDPDQNSAFVDRYLDIPFDLSNVFFVATANSMKSIPVPLLDRMEIIEIPSYSYEEKFSIAKQHLVNKIIKQTGLAERSFNISDELLHAIIKGYTHEAGVRKLEEKLSILCGKVARAIVETDSLPTITPENLPEYLGPTQDYNIYNELKKQNNIGIANGLYWSPIEGGVLPIETVCTPGKGKLKLTGKLAQVMQESAEIAFSHAKNISSSFGIDSLFFEKHDFHIHVPSGAIDKDGPSAGIAFLTSIISCVTKIYVDGRYAMTGELTLNGLVLPIGGLKDKIIAAKRNGIKKVIIPHANLGDLIEFKEVIQDVEIIPITNSNQLLEKVLISVPKKGG